MAAAYLAAETEITEGSVYNLVGGMMQWDGRALPDFPRLEVFTEGLEAADLLYRAMDLEKGAWRFYRAIKNTYAGRTFADVFAQLSKAEVGHARSVYRFWKEVSPDEIPFDALFEKLEGEVLEGGETLQAMLDRVVSIEGDLCLNLMEIAITIENAAFDLYRTMAEKSTDETAREAFFPSPSRKRRTSWPWPGPWRSAMSKLTLKYHEETKHHYHRYARSSGTMDWQNQPNPFRVYEGVPQIRLPFLDADPGGGPDALYCRNTHAEPVSLGAVAGLLELSLGLSAWKEAANGARWALRMNPSSGNLHPTESHLILPPLENCPAGVYHYNPFYHALEQRAEMPDQLWENLAGHFMVPGFLIALTSIFWRESWKYGERAWRYCNLDAGHAVAGLSVAAALFGWKVTALADSGDKDLRKILGLDQVDWEPLEEEYPELICYVHPHGNGEIPRGLPRGSIDEIGGLSFAGKPNLTSKKRVNWEIIYETAHEALKPPTREAGATLPETPLRETPAVLPGAAAIIRQRRSGVAFDGGGSITTDALVSILDRTVPRGSCAPFDAEAREPRISLMLFIHNVTGLPPGLYMFIRNPAHREALGDLCRSDFLWGPMASCDGLYLFEKGSFKTDAMSVSCGQEIAGFSAFSLGMLAEFKTVVRQAAHNYRRLMREAGTIGQVLYLEAEAMGVRGTGIGCFFDDAVHDLLGLTDSTFQSLYHFTIGKPVEDRRLVTRKPYFHLSA